MLIKLPLSRAGLDVLLCKFLCTRGLISILHFQRTAESRPESRLMRAQGCILMTLRYERLFKNFPYRQQRKTNTLTFQNLSY